METKRRTKVKELLNSTAYGSEVTVKGWVRTFRSNRFIAIEQLLFSNGSLFRTRIGYIRWQKPARFKGL